MRTTKLLSIIMLAIGIAVLLIVSADRLSSQQSAAVSIDSDDIGGVVTSAKGPEAGVIATPVAPATRFVDLQYLKAAGIQ